MAVWQLHESRGIGREDKVWKVDGVGLSVGRTSECDIQILSQSVEKRHCVIEWDQKRESYVIRDLGTVNGTFINGLPLRGGVSTLRHGDSVRFGYDKGHLFRVKVIQPAPSPATPPRPPSPSPSPSPSHPPPISTASTQTSPANDYHPPTPSSQVSGIQYVPIPSAAPTVIIPTLQPGVPYMIPQPMSQVYSPHMPQWPLASHMTGHMTPTPYSSFPTSPAPPYWQPQPYPTTPTTPTEYVAPSVTPTVAPNLDSRESRPASSADTHTVASPRKDGRRSVPLSTGNTPNLSKISSLYGQPAWWGEEDPVSAGSGSERVHHAARILRDISTPRTRSSSTSDSSQVVRASSKATRSATSRERRSNQPELSSSPNAAWTVEVGPRRSRAIPPKLRHVRSADSSPVRRGGSEKQSTSPTISPVRAHKTATGSNKDFTPLSQRVTATKPPSGSRKTGRKSSPFPVSTAAKSSRPLHDQTKQGEQNSIGDTPNTAQTSASPSTLNNVSDVPSDPAQPESSTASPIIPPPAPPTIPPPASPPTPPTIPPPASPPTPPTIPPPAPPTIPPPAPPPSVVGLKSQSDVQLGSRKKTDQTFIVKSPTEDERPNSARRQWSHEPEQPQNSLMMASIEARIRRLNKLAQNTYLSLSAAKQNLNGKISSQPPQPFASPGPPAASDSQLPEWKFFNKEVDSIFRNIRSLEGWLKDIDAMVAALQFQCGGDRKEEGGVEHVDFQDDTFCSSDSGGAQFPDSIEDSIEDLQASSSD